MKAVLQFRASTGFINSLMAAAPAWLRIVVVDETDRKTFAEQLADAEVLLHVLEPVTAQVMAHAPNLKLIQKIGVGVNTIDLDAARARGIAVANMPGTNSQAVAEHTLALMLAALRRIPFLDRAMRAGAGWTLAPDEFDRIGEMCGRTVGLVGNGEVPKRLAPVLRALGARVIYTDRTTAAGTVAAWRPLDKLLAEADIVSLHVPLTPETAQLINAETLGQMKPGSILINTARGALVDETALQAALLSGHLAAAGLDVVAAEPAGANHRLFKFDNVVLTPHIAWLTAETIRRSIALAFENCRRLQQDAPLLHQVVP
jgi:phosphoglycerate dehydrogenase-like enzyme